MDASYASQPPAAPVPLATSSSGTSIEEEDDLYVSPRSSPRLSVEVPPTSSAMPSLTLPVIPHESMYSPSLSDYNTWSAALVASPVDPPAQQARKVSESSHASSKRSLPPTPGSAGAEASRAGTTSEASSGATATTAPEQTRKNSLQPTLSQRYQQLKERSAARRASQSSDGHTFITSWERRDSEHSGSSGAGYGRLPALEDVQQQQRFVSSPEPSQPAPPGPGQAFSPISAHDTLKDSLSAFPAPPRERRDSLPPLPIANETSPRSLNRRDSLPPIPGESPTRRPSGALPPIPSEHVPSNPTSPTERNPLPNGHDKGALNDFTPYASVYGGVEGESREGSVPGSRRNTLPPLPQTTAPETKEQSPAQLYAQQQMAQQRRGREQREQRDREQLVLQQQQHPPWNAASENEKNAPPVSAPPSAATFSQTSSAAPPSSFAAPHPPPGQSQSLPTRRSTLPHAPNNYAAQQQDVPRESQSTLRPQRTIGPADARSPRSAATPQPSQGSTPQRTRPVHPEFSYGDLTIQVSKPQEMDFLCSHTILTTASALIASTLAQFPPGKAPRVQISETIPEARLLLSALNYGNINHSSLAVADRDPLSVAEYLTLLRLYQKYQVSAFFTDLLQYQINARAVELSQGVMKRDKALVLDVVRLAGAARSVKLWDMLNKYSQHWFETLQPPRLTQEDKDRLGKAGVEVLVAWNALRLGCGDRPDGVRIGYDGDRVAMWRAKDSSKKFYPCS